MEQIPCFVDNPLFYVPKHFISNNSRSSPALLYIVHIVCCKGQRYRSLYQVHVLVIMTGTW